MIKWAFILGILYALWSTADRFLIHPEKYTTGIHRGMFSSENKAPASVTPATPAPSLRGSQSVGVREVPAAAPAAPAATPAPLWITVVETYRGGDERTYLHTSAGVYEVGTMSNAGMVEGIQGRVARVRDGWGRLVFVVGDLKTSGTPSPLPVVEEPPKYAVGEMSARWQPTPSKLGEAETTRIRSELERPIGRK